MTEALQKLEGGAKFDDVAREFSEDKARVGRFISLLKFVFIPRRYLCTCISFK